VYRNGVTIAIPNWNHELVLPRAVASALEALKLLREEGGDGEVLVIDDQSRDGSVTLLRQLEPLHYEDGLRVLALAKNGGLAAARNTALATARYRHIVFLDADNELIPQNTPCLWQALRETGAAAAFGTLLMRTVTGTDAFTVLSNESIQDRMFDANYIDSFGMFDCGQLADLGGYSTAFTTQEDHEEYLHLATNGRRILFVPVVFGYYYILPTSMSQDGAAAGAANLRIRRIYNQMKARGHLDMTTRHLRYHPSLGYL
jgi:glycosyltransferase involved in cell wall biosynthesis